MSDFRRRIPRSRKEVCRRVFRSRLLVFCASKKTEKQYLQELKSETKNMTVSIKVVAEPGDPLSVVRAARKYWKANVDDFDACWVVTDVDDFDLTAARQEARQAGIGLAVSDPCFEYWLLLHFRSHDSHLSSYKSVERLLAKHVPGYDKSDLDFSPFKGGVADAVERARKRWDECEGLADRNPSTRMHEIVSEMLA
ncbi:RloB family protein [Kitasatospora sp. NBC_01287]|uniref:RloB family protein n=1 Tax=Kitasatospora sp. NBC_01287 TaxID=2903573 RepID=UPI002251BFD3|nr:RloB family protein [Kitasatospora sp. NBC_01287]MCX4747826.1 RloB family protein [Kitasatospora sp. NBC_01287]